MWTEALYERRYVVDEALDELRYLLAEALDELRYVFDEGRSSRRASLRVSRVEDREGRSKLWTSFATCLLLVLSL